VAKVLDRRRLEVEAPEVARKCRPGQFVILMPDERGERIPLSISDWDAARGSVTSVFLTVGTSTHKLSRLAAGDEIPVFVGPLGRPSDIENFGTVLLAGGCFGIGAIYPLARALKKAGNRVLTVIDVKARYLLYWEDKLRAVSDRVFISSRDFDLDSKQYVPAKIEEILAAGTKVDRVIAIGCTYLMYSCAMATKPRGIKTIVSLNPIMVDGTGMCGACRCSAAGRTKFACVDGPDFDGHEIDWEELFKRRKSYFDDEIRSLCYWERTEFP
jgi:ferredoxin--NADP+ reductase